MHMHQFASGPGMAVGLAGSDGPPLSPETVGRAPSFLEAPVPLRPAPATVAAPAPEPVEEPEEEILAPAADVRRLVVRLLGGEEIELASFDGRDAAIAAAQELVLRVGAAEAAGEWPEVEGRFLRPASIASIDVLVED
jgi:hypothetical protein